MQPTINLTKSYPQETYKDQNGTVVGLGFGYRESIELTLDRLSNLIDLDTGTVKILKSGQLCNRTLLDLYLYLWQS